MVTRIYFQISQFNKQNYSQVGALGMGRTWLTVTQYLHDAALNQELDLFYIHYHILEQLVFLFYMRKPRLKEAGNSLKTR